MYLIERNTPLTPIVLGKILQKFQTSEKPKFQDLIDYYNGKQKILLKQATDVGKPNNKVVVNYCHSIVDNYLGYLAGIPINYTNENFDEVIDILKYNDYISEDNILLRDALIYGRSFEINYIDEQGQQRFRNLDARECVPVYDNTLNNDLLYVIRFYREDLVDELNENYIVEVYGPEKIVKYRSNSGFSSFTLLEEVKHYYSQCPITVFSLNKDEKSIFDQVMSLQDSYNQLLSGEVDDWDSFCDAYLVLKGAIADEDDLANMKQNRVLMLDPDASAEYLTKSVSDTQIQNMLANINDHIHKIANSPDFNDKDFMAQSGVALRYKLVGFENQAAAIETQMRRALTRRIELISDIIKLTNAEFIWRDIKIRFTRNLPYDLNEAVNTVNTLRGVVSTKTLLSLLPFVEDVEAELEAVNKEKEENMELYSFGLGDHSDGELLETERDNTAA